jgi:hypothetical protein
MPRWFLPLFVAGKSEHGSSTLKSFSSPLRNPIQCLSYIPNEESREDYENTFTFCVSHTYIKNVRLYTSCAMAFFFDILAKLYFPVRG